VKLSQHKKGTEGGNSKKVPVEPSMQSPTPKGKENDKRNWGCEGGREGTKKGREPGKENQKTTEGLVVGRHSAEKDRDVPSL